VRARVYNMPLKITGILSAQACQVIVQCKVHSSLLLKLTGIYL
jgi:hypothetical protein